jgi:DNA-binding NtrC family response regulator
VQPTVLVVDDDQDFLDLISALLAPHGYRVSTALGGEEALASGPAPQVVLLDWQLEGQSGLEQIGPLTAAFPRTPVVLTTAFSSTEVAVQAMQQGAFDFLPKPVDEARLITTLARAVDQHRLLERVHGLEAGSTDRFEGLLGGSPQMRTVFETIKNVATTDVSVLITGESGTGKELVARAIHRCSARSKKPFVALNMAAIPRELVESTLFGHEKGSFSGADRRRLGACEEADGGTLFLDEIGEMPLELQPKLLRFLQEQTFRRVGGANDMRVDTRIVSATNRSPLDAVREGTLRADLYYRLNVVPVELPPLRARQGDVALIAQRSLEELAARHGKAFRRFTPDALAALAAHDWPGNVRELVHAIERVVITCQGDTVRRGMLPPPIGEGLPIPDVSPGAVPGGDLLAVAGVPAALPSPDVFGERVIPLTELERMAIEHALRLHDGAREPAAKALGISPATIYRKLKSYGLTGPGS